MRRFLKRVTRLPAYVKDRSVQLYKKFRADLYIDLNHDLKNTILVAGSGRGGTTWLAEIINADNDFRDIFEPVRPLHSAACHHFKDRQYLRVTDSEPRFVKPMRYVLEGRTRSYYSDQFNTRFFCSRRIIKEVRLNNLLKWINVHFPEVPLVWIIRHPCAVAHSRLTGTWKGAHDIADLLSQPELVADHLAPFVNLLQDAQDEFERHVAVWCVENYVPWRELKQGDALVIFYEDLCTQPEEQVKRIAQFLSLDNPESMMLRTAHPSSQVRTNNKNFTSAVLLGQDPVSFWKRYVTPAQVQRAMRLVDAFGLSRLYGPEPLPLTQPDAVLQDALLPIK